MTEQHSPRRSRAQWQALIEQWQHSGQSAHDFCQSQGLALATFRRWRGVFATSSGTSDTVPAFVDLGTLAQGAAPARWHIVLSLGNGVELRLSQG